MARQQIHALCFVMAAAALLFGWGGNAMADGFVLGEKTCLEGVRVSHGSDVCGLVR